MWNATGPEGAEPKIVDFGPEEENMEERRTFEGNQSRRTSWELESQTTTRRAQVGMCYSCNISGMGQILIRCTRKDGEFAHFKSSADIEVDEWDSSHPFGNWALQPAGPNSFFTLPRTGASFKRQLIVWMPWNAPTRLLRGFETVCSQSTCITFCIKAEQPALIQKRSTSEGVSEKLWAQGPTPREKRYDAANSSLDSFF